MPSMSHNISANQMPRVLEKFGVNRALGNEGFQLNPRKGKFGRVYVDVRKNGRFIASHRVNCKKVGWHNAYGDREYFKVFFIPQLIETAKIGLLHPDAAPYEID
jgi:hypothetical protein